MRNFTSAIIGLCSLLSVAANAQDTLRINKFTLGGAYNRGNSNSFQITSNASIGYQGAASKHGAILSPDYFLLYTQGTDGSLVKKSEDIRANLFFWRDLNKSTHECACGSFDTSFKIIVVNCRNIQKQ